MHKKTHVPHGYRWFWCAILLWVWVAMSCELPAPPCGVDATQDRAPVAIPTPPADLPRKVLILSMTSGFRHASIEAGVSAMKTALSEAGLGVDATEDVSQVTDAGLAAYGAVIALSATGEFLGSEESAPFQALMAFVAGGGGFLGAHSVGDAYRCGPYQQLVGGAFRSHPGNLRPGTCFRVKAHPAIDQLPETFEVTDEFHLFYNFRASNQVVLECLATDGKTRMPIMWHRSHGKGRIFISTLGHDAAYWDDPKMMKTHIVPAIKWIMGIP